MDTKNAGFNSKLIHAGGYKDNLGSAVTPIYQTSTFSFKNADHGAACFSGESDGFIYTRIGNPTIGITDIKAVVEVASKNNIPVCVDNTFCSPYQQRPLDLGADVVLHSMIDWILYPGLKSHPQYELAKKQMDGPGCMISFGMKGGFNAGKVLMDNVHLALLAVSLGGIETLIQHPASMTHSKLSKEAKEKTGISDGLVRLAIGIEDVEDIINDLDSALSKINHSQIA